MLWRSSERHPRRNRVRAHEPCAIHQPFCPIQPDTYTKLTVAQLENVRRETYGSEMTPAAIQPFVDAAMKYGQAPAPIAAKDLISSAASSRER